MTEPHLVYRAVFAGELGELSMAEGIGAFAGYLPKGREHQREALMHLAQSLAEKTGARPVLTVRPVEREVTEERGAA